MTDKTNAQAANEKAYWREPRVRKTVGEIGKTTLWRWIREGRFPKPVRLGSNCVAWRSDEVEAWLASRPRYDESEAVA